MLVQTAHNSAKPAGSNCLSYPSSCGARSALPKWMAAYGTMRRTLAVLPLHQDSTSKGQRGTHCSVWVWASRPCCTVI